MSKRVDRALVSQLIRLVKHIIKWLTQPEKRTKSWETSIDNARDEIAELRENNKKLTKNYILQFFLKVFRLAKREAQKEMKRPSNIDELTWKQMFDDDYKLDTEK